MLYLLEFFIYIHSASKLEKATFYLYIHHQPLSRQLPAKS